MHMPSYRWVCHKCGATNDPHTETCASCGFPAVTSGEQVERSQPGSQQTYHDANEVEVANRIWLFFPEGIFGVALVVATPFWAVHLALAERIGASIALVTGVGLATYAFTQFLLRGHKYLAYFSLVGALALAFMIYTCND